MKDIVGYEGLYAITSCGKVWSYRSQKFLSPAKNNSGYLYIHLYNKENEKPKNYLIHRLVAEAYIPNDNPEEKTQVNHCSEIKTENHINNLTWITPKDNINYGTRNEKAAIKHGAPVKCIETNMIYQSAHQAARELKLDNSAIIKCCKGKRNTHGGYHWQYIKEKTNVTI